MGTLLAFGGALVVIKSSWQGADGGGGVIRNVTTKDHGHIASTSRQVPGPPFVFGALMVLLALCVSAFIPENVPKNRKASGKFKTFYFCFFSYDSY